MDLGLLGNVRNDVEMDHLGVSENPGGMQSEKKECDDETERNLIIWGGRKSSYLILLFSKRKNLNIYVLLLKFDLM